VITANGNFHRDLLERFVLEIITASAGQHRLRKAQRTASEPGFFAGAWRWTAALSETLISDRAFIGG
jgi:hypothetical protein